MYCLIWPCFCPYLHAPPSPASFCVKRWRAYDNRILGLVDSSFGLVSVLMFYSILSSFQKWIWCYFSTMTILLLLWYFILSPGSCLCKPAIYRPLTITECLDHRPVGELVELLAQVVCVTVLGVAIEKLVGVGVMIGCLVVVFGEGVIPEGIVARGGEEVELRGERVLRREAGLGSEGRGWVGKWVAFYTVLVAVYLSGQIQQQEVFRFLREDNTLTFH